MGDLSKLRELAKQWKSLRLEAGGQSTDSSDYARELQAQQCAYELEAALKAIDAAALRYESNGEAGDGQTVCSFCGDEIDEPHTHQDCCEAGHHRGFCEGAVHAEAIVYRIEDSIPNRKPSDTAASAMRECATALDEHANFGWGDFLRKAADVLDDPNGVKEDGNG